MWAHKAWTGTFFPASTKAGTELAAYSTWCETVEGNTTFYATPPSSTVERWHDETPEDFTFCFKLPRTITHDRRLRNCEPELQEFLDTMAPVRSRLGPVQIQLPASFEPADLPALDAFLEAVPNSFEWAVEVRHPEFSAGGDFERPLNDLLAARGVDRVILDSRALFEMSPVAPEEIEAWERKPRLPVRPVATARQPLIRLIGNRDPEASHATWARWIPKLVEWLQAGLEPHVFTHTPDNVGAPPLARQFWSDVAQAFFEASGQRLRPLPEPVTADEQLDLWDDIRVAGSRTERAEPDRKSP